MKKIGILTFHNVPNYGACLQAFALKKYLNRFTSENVSVLDFRCKGNSQEYSPENYIKKLCYSKNIIKSMLKKVLFSLFAKKQYCEKYKKFEAFKKTQLTIAPYTNVYEEYDYIFCGSDQIWNDDITGGFQLPYFGADKPENSRTKVCSYAASCGDIAEFSQEKKEELFSLIKNLNKISVREKNLNYALNENNIFSVNALDPTFLLSAEEYTEHFQVEEQTETGYVLEYALRPSTVLDSLAKKVAEKKGLKIKKICGYCSLKNEAGIFNAGPDDFVSLVANSDYIVTNSFHGTAFSLIFRKDFNVVLPPTRKGRVSDLLDLLNLHNRICTDCDSAVVSEILYNEVEPSLNAEIEKSKQFINDIF